MSMEKLKQEVAEAVTVMGAAATFIGALRARLKTAQDEASSKGVDIEALNTLSADLDTNANALAEAMKENTAAAAEPVAEEPAAAPAAPAVDPDTGATAPPASDAGASSGDTGSSTG